MATPDQFIEISDFSPGILGDLHASADALPATPGGSLRGTQLTNGAAQVANTFNCKADRSGALVPMNAISVGLTSGPIPHSQDEEVDSNDVAYRSPAFPYAYLLDAQIGPQIGNVRNGFYGRSGTIFTLYAAHLNLEGTGDGDPANYDMYVLGREWRPWSPDEWQTVYDFIWGRNITNRFPVLLPAGSLCLTRWNGSLSEQTQILALRQLNIDSPYFPWTIPPVEDTTALWTDNFTPVVVALVGTSGGGLDGFNVFEQGTIPTAEQAWITKVRSTIDGDQDMEPYSDYSHTYAPLGQTFYPNGLILGMNLPTDITTGLQPELWTFHQQDDFFLEYPYNLPKNLYLALPHQGRVVYVDRVGGRNLAEYTVDSTGALNAVHPTDDALWYSDWGQPINDWYAVDPPVASPNLDDNAYGYMFRRLTPLIVAEDQVAEIGCIGVITGDELLVVKDREGGVIVRGDLDNPTVRRVPYLESTHGLIMKGAQTPLGFVYGSRNGIFSWQGGDSARKLSPQLDGFFWDHTTDENEQYAGSRGRFIFWNEMLAVPNNYFFDSTAQSWWRARHTPPTIDEEAEDYGVASAWTWPDYVPIAWNCYEEDHDGQLHAFPYKINGIGAGDGADEPQTTNDDNNVVWHELDTQRLSSYYSWQSHPLIETRGRKMSFQDVRLVATNTSLGSALIVVTLTGYDQAAQAVTTRAVEFLMEAGAQDYPQILRRDVEDGTDGNFVAEYVTVRVQAWSLESNLPAPKLHALRLGVKDRATTVRAGRA